jgi:hypothetical protein
MSFSKPHSLPFHRSIQHLQALSREFPNVWTLVREIFGRRGKGDPRWPEWCFIPLSGWCEVISGLFPRGFPEQAGYLASRLAAIGTWRYSQGIYRFDSEVYAALTRTVIEKEMPSDVFLRLPEWCVYIESPGQKFAGSSVYGFWAHLEADTPHGGPEMRFLFDSESGLLPFIFRLGPWSIRDAIKRELMPSIINKVANKLGIPIPFLEDIAEVGAAELQPYLSLVLYLCSEQPEVTDRKEAGPSRPQPKRVKGEWKLFPPNQPRIWPIGIQTGEQLRRVRTDSNGTANGRTVSPHIRRAHWHGIWTGPRNGERKFKFNWFPPIMVAGEKKRGDESIR